MSSYVVQYVTSHVLMLYMQSSQLPELAQLQSPRTRVPVPLDANCHRLFECASSAPEAIEFAVKVSFVEIYNERVRDLLSSERTNLRVQAGTVRGAREVYVVSADEMDSILELGAASRRPRPRRRRRTAFRRPCTMRSRPGSGGTARCSLRGG